MERLTTWNGSKYILPQGRTSEGESYWRIIADKLAQYENNEPVEKEMRFGFTDIMMPIETTNVWKFANIYNSYCERVVDYWLTFPKWAERFETQKDDHWMFQELHDYATAFFYMGMLPEAKDASRKLIYDTIKAQVERRKGAK